MTHPLVEQLRFARGEFRRGLQGVTDEEARRRFLPLNCLSWNVGHLAAQEQRQWLLYAQETMLLPEIDRAFSFGFVRGAVLGDARDRAVRAGCAAGRGHRTAAFPRQ